MDIDVKGDIIEDDYQWIYDWVGWNYTSAKNVLSALKKANGEDILESYQLFDVYKGAQIEEGHKSIAYSITYRSKEKTLTDEDVAKVHDKIVSELSEKLNANLRSN